MSKVTFNQTTTASGQIAVALFSSDLPAGGFTFNFAFNYSGSNIQFDRISYSGAAAVTSSASVIGSVGSVSVKGSLSPSSSTPFATLLFDVQSKGTLDVNVTSFQINGSSAIFTDPAPYNFSILADGIALTANSSATGSYKPLDGFFSLSYEVKSPPQSGTVVFGDVANPALWKYTPTAGFYGVDSFTLKVSDVFDAKEKTIVVNVSPVGTAGNDTFHSSAGTYHTDGGHGIDTLQYSGKRADFSVAKSGGSAVVTDKSGAEGVNHLDNFERLKFSDGAIALDIAGNAGQAYRLYQAAFARTPDAVGLGYWINALDQGVPLLTVAEGFMNSSEFKGIYGMEPTNTQLVTRFYENILNRQPEKGGLDFWVGVLDSKAATPVQVLASLSESAENQAGLASIIGNGFAYTPYGN